jgi:hypothetical protein
MGTPRNKSWVELLEEEEILREQNLQERSVPIDDKLSKVKTEVNEVLVNDNVVNSGEESKVNVNVKEELEYQEDEEERLRKELDMFEHEWVREIKQEQLNENQVQDIGVTHHTNVIKQENDDQAVETCEVARYWVDIPSKVEVERAKERFFCEQTNENLDADNQILRNKDEELHTPKLEETKSTDSRYLNLDSIREEVSRKRGRNWQNDNKRQKVSHRYVYCIFCNTLFLVCDLILYDLILCYVFLGILDPWNNGLLRYVKVYMPFKKQSQVEVTVACKKSRWRFAP